MLMILLACTDAVTPTDDSEPVDQDVALSLDGACEMAEDFGGFVVLDEIDSASVDGRVADGVVPISVLEETASEGDCRLLRRNNPFCDPACDPGETCDFDGTCLPYPANQDLGVVTITGLVQEVTMEPVFPGNTYFDTSLPYPGWEPGGLIVLDMPGGVYGPVQLTGVGVESLTGVNEPWQVEAGVDLAILWDAPTVEPVHSQIDFFLNIDLHGTSPSVMRCTFADTGSATVSGEVIQALIDTGVTGFPSAGLERRTVDRADVGEGCMDLEVSSSRDIEVDVAGFTPCVGDQDCPDGQECILELQICRDVEE
jgi:hypothetical protein